MAASIFGMGVLILAAGFVWFWIARPILEGCGIIRDVSDYQEEAPALMSRVEDSAALYSPSSLQTDSRQTDRQPTQAQPGRAELLTLYQTMRAAGISREKARPVLKGVGLPLDNNLWADAAPTEDAAHVTPIVGRRTSAQFETDPEFPYVAPSH